MPCDACGCACRTGGQAPKEEELEAPLLDIETGPGHTAVLPPDAEDKSTGGIDMLIFLGLFVLLWVYLLDSMRRFAIKYTDGDIWFSTLAVLLMALPLTELFLLFIFAVDNFHRRDNSYLAV